MLAQTSHDLEAVPVMIGDELVLGQEVVAGRYVVEAVVGHGGMGQVLLARDRVIERRVALKRARPDLPARLVAPRLRDEARMMARAAHRTVVQLHDVVEAPGGDVLVLEYVDGPTLEQLRERNAFGVGGVLRMGLELATGLAWIHAQRIVHLDLKLENVLVGRDGQPRIADFGIARCLVTGEPVPSRETTGEHLLVGTPGAMSPEQIAGRPVDARSDLFSLGVVLYELLGGCPPFVGETAVKTIRCVLHARQRSLGELSPALAGPISDLVDQLLEKEPALRPQSAEEVALRLAALLGRL